MMLNGKQGRGLLTLAIVGLVFLIVYMAGLGNITTVASQTAAESPGVGGFEAYAFSNLHLLVILFFFVGLSLAWYALNSGSSGT